MKSAVCVFLMYRLLVTAYPTSDEVDQGVSVQLPVVGLAEFNGTAPATGSVAIIGHASCPEMKLEEQSIALAPLKQVKPLLDVCVRDNEAIMFTDTDEPSLNLKNDQFDSNDKILKKVILGAMLADSIMADKGAEIDAKLEEIEDFVETELETIGPLIQSALTHADTSEIDDYVDSTLLDMESHISSELSVLNEFIETELEKTEDLVQSAIKNVEIETAKYPNGLQNTQESTENDSLKTMELALLDAFVESKLAESEALIESELQKVNAFVESELEKVDIIVDSKLAEIDSLVENKLAKTDAVVISELSNVESIVETELAKVGIGMRNIADLDTASSDSLVTTGFDENDMSPHEDPMIRTIKIDGTFPVSGRTLIFGTTGCPSPFPTSEPLPLYVESFPVFETVDYEDSSETELASNDIVYEYDDGSIVVLPIKGETVFSEVVPAVDSCTFQGSTSDTMLPVNRGFSPPMVGQAKTFIPFKKAPQSYNRPYFTISEKNEDGVVSELILYHKKRLPMVNILKNRLKAVHKPKAAIIAGDVEFSGIATAEGSTNVVADFTCPPLTATEEGPDGKKYIWISKKSTGKDATSDPEVPSCSDDFPDTAITDSNKNDGHVERLDVDFGLLGSLPVIE